MKICIKMGSTIIGMASFDQQRMVLAKKNVSLLPHAEKIRVGR